MLFRSLELPENIGYFHASYRQEHPVQKGRSYTVIDNIRGKGQFAGLTLAAGMNAHVAKPIDLRMLARTVAGLTYCP